MESHLQFINQWRRSHGFPEITREEYTRAVANLAKYEEPVVRRNRSIIERLCDAITEFCR